MGRVSQKKAKHPSDDSPKDAEQLNQRETAAYIADATLGLQGLARRADLPFLAYLLHMAAQEAIERSERK